MLPRQRRGSFQHATSRISSVANIQWKEEQSSKEAVFGVLRRLSDDSNVIPCWEWNNGFQEGV